MAEQSFETKLGEQATFVVKILFQQNSTWQGSITWVEKQKTERFRSTLEMIKLMDSAVAQVRNEGSDFEDWQ